MLPGPGAPGADLPVRPALAPVAAAVGSHGTALLVAPPGSGKTSLLPLALADAVTGRVVVAEPRRLATRAAAARLAALLGERVGGRVGYAMRGERVGGPDVRVEVVTTGLLVRRLQRDPELPGVSALVVDECHERQLDSDLLLAFAGDVRATLREDLAVVATSATPDVDALRRALGADVPVVAAEGLLHPVDIVWAPPPVPVPLRADGRVDDRMLEHVAATTRRALAESDGDVLVFVPGEREVDGVVRRMVGTPTTVLPLFGRQSRAEQDRALSPAAGRRVVVTTAVAESSLTVPGVRVVVDAGLSREPRTDHERGLGRLVTTAVSRAAADQRAGRAGREGPGRAYRCWSADAHARLDRFARPEIAVADLTGFALACAAWGAPGAGGLALPDPPPGPALEAATDLLRRLGAVEADGRVTDRGRRMAELGVHPRLARAVLDGAPLVGGERARGIVALLSDESLTGRASGDDLAAVFRAVARRDDPGATRRWRDEQRRLGDGGPPRTHLPDDLAVATVAGLAFPDRVGRRRRADGTSYLLANGTGAALDDASPLRGSPWLAIVGADRPSGRADARVRLAAPLDETTARLVAGDALSVRDEVAWRDGALVARRVEALGAIVLHDEPLTAPDPLAVAAAVRDGLRASGLGVLPWPDAATGLRARLAFLHARLGEPWPDVADEALLERLDEWLGPDLVRVRRDRDLARVDTTSALRRLLPWPAATRLDELAPERLTMPTGSRIRVAYDGDAAPVVAVRLQEVLGWTSTPALADGRVPVVLHLLSPAGRTAAITGDLASFWRTGYAQVRADLRARYPKHAWPEDPLTATPTRGVRR
ncbi:ATP-dependent helicase HrpB [Jatrophihabitans fulvus]